MDLDRIRALMARRDLAATTMHGVATRLLRDLADEVPGLVAEIERLQAGGCARGQRTTQHCAEAESWRRVAERLEREKAEGFMGVTVNDVTDSLGRKVGKQRARIAELKRDFAKKVAQYDKACEALTKARAMADNAVKERDIANAATFRHELREAKALALVERAFRTGHRVGANCAALEPCATIKEQASQRERDWLAFVAKANASPYLDEETPR